MRQTRSGLLLTLWLVLAGPVPVQSAAAEPQQVAFNTADGFWVHADYHGPTTHYVAAPIAILLHAEHSDRQAWKPLIEPLHEAGFVILALDMRGHGQSATSETRARLEQRDPQLFRDIQNDLRGAYDWLAQQEYVDRARFALVGAGAGAAVALQYAAEDRSVDVVVCLSPTTTTPGLDAAGDLGQIHGRKILLVATQAEQDECDQLAKRTTGVQAHTCKDLDGTPRGTDILDAAPKIQERIVDFLVRGVGRPTMTTVYGSIRSRVYHAAGSAWIKEISTTNLRHYSSPREAETRGLRPSKSKGPRGGKGSAGQLRRPPRDSP